MSSPDQATPKPMWVKVHTSRHDKRSSVSTHGWLWRKGWNFWVIQTWTLSHGKVLTFPDSTLDRSLCAFECSKVFLFFHPVPPTIYHRIGNGPWGHIIIPVEVETHTGHNQYSSGNDYVQSKHFSAPLVQGVHTHDYNTYLGGEKYNQYHLKRFWRE